MAIFIFTISTGDLLGSIQPLVFVHYVSQFPGQDFSLNVKSSWCRFFFYTKTLRGYWIPDIEIGTNHCHPSGFEEFEGPELNLSNWVPWWCWEWILGRSTSVGWRRLKLPGSWNVVKVDVVALFFVFTRFEVRTVVNDVKIDLDLHFMI